MERDGGAGDGGADLKRDSVAARAASLSWKLARARKNPTTFCPALPMGERSFENDPVRMPDSSSGEFPF